MKGIVGYETLGFVVPEDEGLEAQPKAPFRPTALRLADLTKLTK